MNILWGRRILKPGLRVYRRFAFLRSQLHPFNRQLATKVHNQKSVRRLGKSFIVFSSISAATLTYLYFEPPINNFYIKAGIRSLRSVVTGFISVCDYKWSLRNKDCLTLEEYQQIKNECHQRAANRLLATFKRNGGIYVKLGQHISALVYLLPPEYVETMKNLQDQCNPTSIEDINALFLKDMGMTVLDVFEWIDANPIGVASLAQVHRAILKNGEEVAIKIQHPDLEMYATMDIAIVSSIVNIIRFLFPEFEFGWLSDEMKTNLPNELNFVHEAANAETVQRNFLKTGKGLRLKIPKVMWATKRLLCMEFIHGSRIDDLNYYLAHHINFAQVSSEVTRIFSTMIFQHGFTHADPHPGNLLIQHTPQPSLLSYINPFCHDFAPWKIFTNLIIPQKNFVVVLLDHGLYRSIDDNFRLGYARLWRSLIRSNEREIRYYSKRVANVDMYQLFSSMLTARAWETITSDIRTARTDCELDAMSSSAGKYFLEITQVLSQVPRTLLLLFKTNDLLRSIEKTLGGSEWISIMIMGEYVMYACATEDAIMQDEIMPESIWKCYWEWLRFAFVVKVYESGLIWKERLHDWL